MLYYKFFNLNGRGLKMRLVLIALTLLFICNISILAVDSVKEPLKENAFYQLPEFFFQDDWVESADNVNVYLLNFQEIDKEVTESSFFKTYLLEKASSDMSWSYSNQEELIEFINLYNKNNSVTINSSNLNLSKAKNYTSWLMAHEGQSSEIVIRERTLSVDRVKGAEDDRLLKISLTPLQVSLKKQEILTEVNLHYGSSSDENTVKTTIWLDNTRVQTLAVISKKSKTANGERRQYYALQLAAISLPVEQLATIDGSFLAIGNLNGLNKIFDNDDINNKNEYKDMSTLTIGIGSNGERFAYSHSRGKAQYNIELNKSSRYQGLNYSINTDFSLIQKEDLYLSLRVGNENNIKLDKRNYESYDKDSDIYTCNKNRVKRPGEMGRWIFPWDIILSIIHSD